MKYQVLDDRIDIDIRNIENENIQSFLDEYIPSKKMQHYLLSNNFISIDERPVKRESSIAGDSMKICLYSGYSGLTANYDDITVLYEDELVIAVHKKRGFLVHTDKTESVCLAEMVQRAYSKTGICPFPLHRLDKETSGIVLFSKSPVFQPLLDNMIREKNISRTYEAVVKGNFRMSVKKVISLPIGRDRHNSGKYRVSKTGKESVTVVDGCIYSKEYDMTKVICHLRTGRTHQIRVHLASLGHGIINDSLYGEESDVFAGMGLSAVKVEYSHPLSGKHLKITDFLDVQWNGLFQE